jgi:hypothetical protein
MLLPLVIALIALLAAPSRLTFAQQATPAVTGVPNPTVRFVNASPDAPAVDVSIDGKPIAKGVAFGSASDYASLPPGDHRLQVAPVDGGSPIIDQTITLQGWTPYILAAVGQRANIQLQTYQVDPSETPQGQARVRFINAVTGGPNLDLGIAGSQNPLFTGVGFPNAADYQGVNVGAYDLEVRNTDSGEVLLTTPGIHIDAGQVYDIFAIGEASNQSIRLLPLTTPVDVPCSETLNIGESTNTCLRLVHASPDAGPVDVYIGQTRIAEGLKFGNATDFVPAPNGSQQLRVVAAGAPLDQAVIDTTQDFTSGRAFQIMVTGLKNDLQATIAGVDLRALPENQARVRVVHASPDLEAIDVSLSDGSVPFQAIDYRTQSGYVVFNAGTYSFQLRESGSNTFLLEAQNVEIKPATVYDIIVMGQSEAGTLQMVVLEAPANVLAGQSATPVPATPATASEATPAETVTPVLAVASTPVTVTPGAVTPVATPAQ